MTETEFLDKLSAILEVEDGPLTTDRPVEPLFWESLEVIGTIDLIDRAGATARVADILGCQTVADLVALAKLGPTARPAERAES